MKNMSIVTKVLAGAGLLICAGLSAKVFEVGSTKKFYHFLDKKPFAVALFCDTQSAACRHELQGLKLLSNLPRYKQAGMQFIQANTCKGDIESLMEEYHIVQEPTYLLFSHSLPLKSEQGELITRQAPAAREQVQAFIEENLGDDLDEELEEKERECERRRQERLAYGPYFYFGYGYPWWNSWGYPWATYPYYPCPYCW